jgi:outer membrane immunogenic protein
LRAIGIGLLAAVLGPTIAASQNAAPQERQAAPQERQAAPQERQAAPQERQAAPQERQAAPQERQAAQPRQRQAAPNWSGGQIGGSNGVSFVNIGFVEPGAHLFAGSCFSGCVETPFSFSGHSTSATGGLFAGYRDQFGNAVVGFETDMNAKNGSNSHTLSDANAFRAETFTGSVKETWDGSVRGRVGFLVTPWTLLYGTSGFAYGSVGGSFSYAAHQIVSCLCTSVNGGGSWTTTRIGATGGAGIETMLTPWTTLRLECRYTDLGRFSENVGLHTVCVGVCSFPSSNALINLHPTFQTVTLGLAFNF